MSKLYFKKNGAGIESSCTLSVPITIGRNYKDINLDVIETSKNIIVANSDDLAAMQSKHSNKIISIDEYKSILMSEAITMILEDKEEYIKLFQELYNSSEDMEAFRGKIYEYMSNSEEDFTPYPEDDDIEEYEIDAAKYFESDPHWWDDIEDGDTVIVTVNFTTKYASFHLKPVNGNEGNSPEIDDDYAGVVDLLKELNLL